ncbi:MAG: glycoside hydrolase family 30 protein [Steroidobacteraceae bacterium]
MTTGPAVRVTETSGDGSMLLSARAPVSFGTGGSAAAQLINVDESIQYQVLDGLGASLTDSSAFVIRNDLDATQRAALLQDLFGPAPGIALSILRQPMGASDFAVNGNYSYDDVAAGMTDPQLSAFSIAHDEIDIVPTLQQALAINPALKLFAVPWSAPAWMKTSGTMNGGGLDTTFLPQLAQYFLRFLQSYQQDGIAIYAISMQNEPLNSTSAYPSANVPADIEADFIANDLGPTLAGAGFDTVKILGYDHNWDNTSYSESLLASAAAPYLAGSAFHCYAGDVGAQSTVHAAFPDKDIWFTECSGTVGSDFAADLVWNTRNLLIGATRNWARGVSLWNLALDQDSGPTNGGCMGCRGVVTIDPRTTPATITRNVEYYSLGQLSRFVSPGARRIESNSFANGGIEDVAFQNADGSIVLLVLNPAQATQSFSVAWHNTRFDYSLSAQSVATFVWSPT